MKNGQSDTDIFDLDQNRLDEEWLGQSKLYMTYASQLADARAEWERAKASRDLVSAELDRDIRSNPDKYDLVKITEGGVEKTIITQRGFQTSNEAVIKAKHKVDLLQATVEALDHRKKSLEALVSLWIGSYFSDPKAPKEGREKVDEITKRNIRQRGVKCGKS